jgi:APA family basic amino acid/polyamine antiporter
VGALICYGIKKASFFNNILVVLKTAVILLFVFYGFGYINVENLQPLIPENQGNFGQFGWSGIFRGAGFLFFAFIGFDALSTLAQESRNPKKDLPIGMLSSLGISTIVYIIVAIILVGIVPYKDLGVADPIAVAFNALGPKFLWLRIVVKLAILAGLSSVILVLLLGQTRIWFAMAKDGLLPKAFGMTHPKTRTPMFASLMATCIAMLMASFFPVEMLGQLVSMGALLAFGIVCLGVLILRYKEPHIARPFKTPFFPWIPLLGSLSCFVQMALMPGTIWSQLLIWMAIGGTIYFTYGRTRSKLRIASAKQ